MEVFNGQVTRQPEEAKSVFIINDIALEVPPTHISIRKEDMVWQWKTLRTNASTKIPSGRGVVQVSVRLIFVPNDFLVMHRLIVEFKHSPFCFIENALIRESIVPDWLHTQMMAFTMTGLNVQNLTGSPGTFVVDLDLRWFNYAPYAINWLYRDEYATKPIGPEQIVKTIATFGPGLKKQTTIVDFEGRGIDSIESYEILSQTKDIVGGFTMDDILFNHAGTAFDLLPRPTDVMQKAKPVVPHLSNIYKRYINSLQQQSLYHNFNVDIAQMIKDEEMNPQIRELLVNNASVEATPNGVLPEEVSATEIRESYQGSTWKMFTSGHVIGNQDGGYNRVEALHSEMLPSSVKTKVISKCLSYCRYVNFYWHQYIVDENDLSIKRKIAQSIQEAYAQSANTFIARARLLDNIVSGMVSTVDTEAYSGQVNLKSIADVELIPSSAISSQERITYTVDDIKTKYLALIPTVDKAKQEEASGTPYLFHPVVEDVTNFSGFGMRKLEHEEVARAHNGIDLQSSVSQLMYAPFDGELIVRCVYPYNTFKNQNYNYFIEKDLGSDNKATLRANNLFTSSGSSGGTSVEIISSEFPGYSAYFAHMVDIGVEGKINNQQVVQFFKDPNDPKYGGATVLLEKIKVNRGDVIGKYGNTGGSTGAHLHLTIKKDGIPYDPLPFLIAKDVSGLNESDLDEAGIDSNGLPLPEVIENERLGTSPTSPDDKYLTSPSGVLLPETQSTGSVSLTDEERKNWESKEYAYISEGFIPYDDMKDVTNVRKRTVKFSFGSANNNFFPGIVPDFLNGENIDFPQEDYVGDSTHIFSLKSSDNIVITNVVGSLNHVVASIPLLGHEFPTHQHLGSIEPSYTIELVTQADSLFSDNLSAEGSLLEYMRSTLQKNARDFRVIPDSYSVATDHFITRLLGTFRDDDLSFYANEGGLTEVEELKKRSLINRVSTETVEGHPGLSTIQLSLVETNPYVSEDLNVESNSSEDERDALIKEVLHRLYNMNLSSSGKIQKIVEDYSSDIYTEEQDIRQVLESAGLSPKDFGKKTWEEITELVAIKATRENDLFSTVFSSQDTINKSLEIKEEEAWRILAELQEQASEQNFMLYGDYHQRIGSAKDALKYVPVDDRESGEVTFFYNMSDFYTVYPELKPSSDNAIQNNQLDLTAKHTVLKEILRSASISLAESELGLPDNLIADSLYNLPVQAEMMSAFLYWLRKYMEKIAKGASFTDDSTDLANAINIEESDIQNILSKISWNITEKDLTQENKNLIDTKYELLEEATDIVGEEGFESFTGSDTGNVFSSDSGLLEDFKSAVQDLVDKYFETFVQIQVNSESLSLLEQTWKDIGNFIQDNFSKFTGRGTSEVKFDAYTTTKNQISYLLQWFFSPDTLRQLDAGALGSIYQALKSVRGAMFIFDILLTVLTLIVSGLALIEPTPGGEAAVAVTATPVIAFRQAVGAFSRNLATKLATPLVRKGVSAVGATSGAGAYILGRSSEEVSVADEESAAYQLLMKKVASPNYQLFINKETESQKVSFFRKKLIEIAENVISNPSLLAALGIRTENYSLKPFLNEWVGTECYPDLQLPEHPYYVGTHSYAMSPDFYMWNTYEDGGAEIKGEVKRIVEKGVKTVVDNSYQFMKRMQDKGLQAVKDGGMQENNGMQDTLPRIQSLGMLPEGSNTSKVMNPGVKVIKSGPNSPLTLVNENGGPVWDTFDASVNAFRADPIKETEAWSKLLSKADGELLATSFLQRDGTTNYINHDVKSTATGWYTATNETRPLIAFNNADGNVQYSDSATPIEAYETYLDKIKTINEMFGSRQGYLGEVLTKKNAAEIVSETQDTLLSSLSESENWYTAKGIEEVVKHSAADIISEKVTIKRAYPTFKLYFVEEDEEESRWLNLDDFYSFNAVKEFNFYQSRKEASSTATIVLQNISGTLDGTRRSAIVDLDYFNRKQADSIQKKNPGVEVLADNKQHVSSKDQPFDAIVLRPGMNVQLRVGYSNDPNMLHVLLNGRVVDVQWNMTGDLTELTVQSFGTELNSTKKGIGGNDYSINWDERVYYTTHQLLGSLMMDRDLRHFGRWEFGRLTQIGEDKNADLDFYPYQDEGFLGGHPITKWTYETFVQHPFMIGLAIGAAGAFIASKGKISLFAAKPVGSFFSKVPLIGNFLLRTGRIAAVGGDDIVKAVTAIRGSRQATQIWAALGRGTSKSLDEAIAVLNISDVGLLSNIDKLKVALNGLSGGVRAKQIKILSNISARAGKIGGRDALLSSQAEALARWQSASKWLYYPRFGFGSLRSWSGVQNNLWSIGQLTLGNVLIKSLSNTLAVGLPTTAGIFVAENLLQSVNYFGIPEIYKNIKKRTQRINARLKMSPADDNIFCPSPASYMTLRKIRDMGTKQKWGFILNGFINSTVGVDLREIYTQMKAVLSPEDIDPELFEKRVLPPSCQYKIHASTIWEVFEEMTLRHPGWIWGTRPYGTEFRDTMFFGTPSQRYWSKPAEPSFVLRMNKLHEYIKRTGETESVLRKQITEVYGSTIADKMFEESNKIVMDAAYESMTGSSSRESIPTTLDLLKDKFRVAIMDEWLKGMEQRFEPFRRYHLLTSETDIISNNIISSEHSVQNGAQISYQKMDPLGQLMEEKEILQMKAHSLIPDDMVNTVLIDKHNCISYKMALRYGQGAMIYGMKEMYRGEISILGNPRIRPWDVCILSDSYNDISGPIEVESVVHMFSHETGFITEIKPNALVIGNEIATFPVLEALKIYAMARADLNNRDMPTDVSAGTDSTPNKEMKEYFNKRYKEIFDTGSDEYIKEINKTIEESRLLQNLGMKVLPEGIEQNPNFAGAWSVGKGIAGAATIALGAIAAGTGAARLPQLVFAGNKAAKVARITGTAVAGGAAAAYLSPLTPSKTSLVNSAASYIGSKLLFAKCMEQDTIMIIPLIKGKRPIVSGMTMKNPSEVFESILGSVSNVMEDTIVGTRDMFESWLDYKSASWMQVDDMVTERSNFLRRWHTGAQIFYNWEEDQGGFSE